MQHAGIPTPAIPANDSASIAGQRVPTVRSLPADASEAPRLAREAILYVPGLLGQAGETQTIVAKLAEALADFGAGKNTRYAFAANQAPPAGSANEIAPGYTITEKSAQGPIPIYDVFTLAYGAEVADEYLRANPLLKAFQLVFALHWLGPALVKTLLHGYRKTASQRRQLWYVLAILLGLALYFALTLLALVHIVAAIPISASGDASGGRVLGSALAAWFARAFPALAFLIGAAPVAAYPTWHIGHSALFGGSALNLASYSYKWCVWALEEAYRQTIVAGGRLAFRAPLLVVVLTALGLSVPRLRANFEAVSSHLLAAIEYFRIGFARNKTTGQFHHAFAELCAADYERVHVMCFSFGCLVALDSLFYTRGIAQNRIDRLGDFITIGAPITMAQAFWPKHFDVIRSKFSEPAAHCWINVACALDVVAAPILDRKDGKPIVEDNTITNGNQTRQSPWEAFRRREFRRQLRAVEADAGDPNNINFAQAVNLDYSGWYPLDLDWAEFFSLAALRAHTMYWTPLGKGDYNAFDRIAPHLLRVRIP